MRIDIHIHPAPDPATGAALDTIVQAVTQLLKGQKTIMATQAQDAARVTELGSKLDKISAETTSLVEAVRALKDQVGQSDPALTAAIDSIVGKADAIDALVDDIAPNPTPTPEPTPDA